MDTTQGDSFFSNFPGMQSGPTFDDGLSAKFSEPSLRQNFIRKVLLIVTAQVIATAFIVGILISNERWLDNFSNSTSGWWLLCLNTLIGFITYITLLCSKSIR
jgi:FtsH-binding integral membrane protein